jgi:hypothetical protein
MKLISGLTPTNLLEEKEKFFADQTYNPQFTYNETFSASELEQFGHPKPAIVSHSFTQLLVPTPEHSSDGKEYITETYIQEKIDDFNQRFDLEESLEVIFSSSLVSRCTVGKGKIYFQLPIRYTKQTFADLSRHELETHTLRRINHASQQWPEGLTAEQEDLGFRKTEEGLATLHTYLTRKEKLIARTYISYIGVYLAQRYSFSEMYQKLRMMGCSTQRSWNICVRNKRGVTDTSELRAFTKDIVYLEGVLRVWDWIINQRKDPSDLYIGRVSLEQAEEFKSKIDTSKLRFPSFFDDINTYYQNIKHIGEANHFHTLLKEVSI